MTAQQHAIQRAGSRRHQDVGACATCDRFGPRRFADGALRCQTCRLDGDAA